MTELDFEELDRAVKSAIGDLVDETNEDNAIKDTNVSLPEGDTPASSPVTTHNPAPPKTPVSNKSAANAPTKKVRSLDSFSAPSQGTSKPAFGINTLESKNSEVSNSAAATIRPTNSNYIARSARPTPGLDIIKPTKPKEDSGALAGASADTVQPEVPVQEMESLNVPENVESLEAPSNLEESIKEQKDTPFIENLKVDKRPLGAFSDIAKQELKVTTTEEVVTDQSVEAPTYIGGVDEASELPQELRGDVLAVESTGMIQPDTETSGGSVKNKMQAELNAPSNEDSGTVHTSEAYNKPLAHPAKKKTGWLTVFLIVLLIILGAGIGFAIYYFMYMV